MPLPAPPTNPGCCLNGVTSQAVSPLPEPVDPKRWITATETCEFVGPEPECFQYKRVTRHWNCPLIEGDANLPEELWFQGAVSIPTPSEEIIMALTLTPVGTPTPTCERADTLPLLVPANTAPADIPTLLAAALAAAPVDYATFSAAAATDEVLFVGAVPTVEGGAVLHNGIAVGSVSDPDGVNLASTIGTSDCDVLVTFCLTKCLTKAEIAAL